MNYKFVASVYHLEKVFQHHVKLNCKFYLHHSIRLVQISPRIHNTGLRDTGNNHPHSYPVSHSCSIPWGMGIDHDICKSIEIHINTQTLEEGRLKFST